MGATLQTIFTLGFAAYAVHHALPAFIRKAAWCIINCRTAILGGHVEACPEGHFARNHYNSCKHRICPQCAFIQVVTWLTRQKARLLACDHYHVIFTIPHEFNCLWEYNAGLLTDMLFAASRDTILELLADGKYLGARPGIIASLHTWSKTLILHPHIHCLVTGGGITEGKWHKLRRDYLFPMAVARKLFRGKVVAAIQKAVAKKRWQWPPHLTAEKLAKIITKTRCKKWNVHIREKYRHGEGVLTYLARYLRGGPIANKRIVTVENDHVTFNVGREKRALLRLSIEEFLRRFLQHIPQPRIRVVRSYGLYATNKKAELAQCHKLLGTTMSTSEQPRTWQEIMETRFAQSKQKHDAPWQCPICGKPLVRQRKIEPLAVPSPAPEVKPCRVTWLLPPPSCPHCTPEIPRPPPANLRKKKIFIVIFASRSTIWR